MINNEFEKRISDKLNHAEVQPSEGLLDAIFEKRAARPRPFVGLIKLFSVAAAVTVLVTSVYMFNGKNDGAQGIAKAPEQVQPTAEAHASHSRQPDNVSNNGSKGQELQVSEAPGHSSVSNPAPNHRHQVKPHGSYAGQRNSFTRNTESNVGTPARLVSYDGNEETRQDQVIQGDDVYYRYFNVDANNRPSIAREEHKGNSHLYVYHNANDKLVNEVTEMNTFLSLPGRDIRNFNHTASTFDNSLYAYRPIDKNTLKKRTPLYIDAMYGSILTSHSAMNNSNLRKYANSISVGSYNSQYGVRVSMPIGHNINLFSGIFMQNQSNLYRGTIQHGEPATQVNKIVSYINDPVKGPVMITTYDTVNYTAMKSSGYDFRNTYKLFQLPVGASYCFGYHKFDFSVNASALINVFTSSTGRIINVHAGSSEIYTSTSKYAGIGSGLSFMAAYPVTPKFKLILEPGLQYFKIHATKAGNNMNEGVFNKQLSIGLRYTLF